MSDIRSKIQWAEKRLGEFKAELAVFRGTDPYTVRIETDSESGKPVVHILKADPIPPEISLLAGDVFQNLRTALDYLACALVRASGADPTGTAFPILDGPIVSAKDEKFFSGKVEGMRKEIIQAIRDIHPYQGGDNKLWRLHRLNNIDKHNLLVAAWGSITAVNGLPPINDRWVNSHQWAALPGIPFPLKQGTQFVVDIPGVKVDKNTGFFAEIALNQPGVAEGYPLISAVVQSLKRVKEVIGKFSIYLK
jgi:hypothetical protein